MRTLVRWVFRIALALAVLGILISLAALLLKDSITKSMAEKNLRDRTGMDAKIARFEVGLMTPTVNLEGLKLYNTAEFGGGTFLEMPELRIEYLPDQIRGGKLQFKTVRLHIAEVNVVIGKDGRTNLDAIQNAADRKTRRQKKPADKRGVQVPGVEFGGIDTLYLTVGKLKITDLRNPRNNQEIVLGLKDEVGRNLKTDADIVSWFGSVVVKRYLQHAMRNPGDPSLRNLLQGGLKRSR